MSWACFGRRGGDDAVGHAQNVALAVDARVWGALGRVLGDAVLHVAQGVEHVHHRHVAPIPLQLLGHEPESQ
jgi:hypothetical protein